MAIELSDLKFRNGAFTLRIPELQIKSGKITGIIGKNGSGKSTMLKLITGALRPGEGEIRIDTKNVRDYSFRELARKVSFVQQEIVDPLVFTVREVMDVSGYSRENNQVEMIDALRSLGIESLVSRRFSELSGGERRLVSVAASIYQNSEIMLLDEPTTFLDVDKQMVVHQALQGLKEQGKTVIVVLHDINTINKISDESILMKAGEVMESGETNSVMTPETLKRCFDVDFNIYDTPEGKTFVPSGPIQYD